MPDYVLQQIANCLEMTGDFRILRRVPDCDDYRRGDTGEFDHIGIVLDVETTGLDAEARVIELAMLKFEFNDAGELGHVIGSFSGLQEPNGPLSPQITALTGLTDAMLAGQNIDADAVFCFAADADLVIAHNSRFDRPFTEAAWPIFCQLPWACSYVDIPWLEEGIFGARLNALLIEHGLFHDGHRALEDCKALLHLLANPLPKTGRAALRILWETAQRGSCIIWAIGAPFDMKDVLKTRGYRWSPGDGSPRAWYIEVAESVVPDEVDYLRREIYRDAFAEPLVSKLTSRERFSRRTPTPLTP